MLFKSDRWQIRQQKPFFPAFLVKRTVQRLERVTKNMASSGTTCCSQIIVSDFFQTQVCPSHVDGIHLFLCQSEVETVEIGPAKVASRKLST